MLCAGALGLAMGTLIQLPKRDLATRPAALEGECQIMIFPGVRIERPQPKPRAPQAVKPRKKRVRKSG